MPSTFTLGITGGIGSGKSSVCRLLKARGARVFYADAEARRLMHDDASLRAALSEMFGPQTYSADGHLDRAYVAAQVFGNPEKLARLNALVHPRVFTAFNAAREQAEADGVPLLIKEAALIFETGGEKHLDAVAVVDAPVDVRLARVMARDKVPAEAVEVRMRAQLPPEELRRRAHFVIENDGDPTHLEREVDLLLAWVETRRNDR